MEWAAVDLVENDSRVSAVGCWMLEGDQLVETSGMSSPLDQLWSLLGHLINVNATIVAVVRKWFHVQFRGSQDVSLADFDHGTPFRNATPCGVEQLSRE